MTAARIAVCGLGLLLAAGCAAPKKPVGHVKGQVTLDGRPMAAGRVVFDRSDGGVPTTLTVTAGAFEGDVPAGPTTVRISAYKDAPGKTAAGPGGGEAQQVNVVPARYNTESTDVREVTAAGPNEFTFDVKSK